MFMFCGRKRWNYARNKSKLSRHQTIGINDPTKLILCIGNAAHAAVEIIMIYSDMQCRNRSIQYAILYIPSCVQWPAIGLKLCIIQYTRLLNLVYTFHLVMVDCKFDWFSPNRHPKSNNRDDGVNPTLVDFICWKSCKFVQNNLFIRF